MRNETEKQWNGVDIAGRTPEDVRMAMSGARTDVRLSYRMFEIEAFMALFMAVTAYIAGDGSFEYSNYISWILIAISGASCFLSGRFAFNAWIQYSRFAFKRRQTREFFICMLRVIKDTSPEIEQVIREQWHLAYPNEPIHNSYDRREK